MAWFAAAAPYIGAGSSLLSAGGQQQAGQQQQQAAQFNAAIEQQRGQIALDQATVDAQQVAQDAERRVGQARADYGAAGVSPNSGSPLAVLSDMATQGELARQLTLYRGKIAALGANEQAELDRYGGQQAAAAGNLRAGTTLLTSASRYAGNYSASSYTAPGASY